MIFSKPSTRVRVFVVLLASMRLSPVLAQSVHGIAAANINVVQVDTNNTVDSVTVTAPVAFNGFAIRPGSNRGDYNVQVGPNPNDDVSTGLMMTSVAENGRNNGESAYPGINFCTSALDYSRSGANAGAYFLPVFNAPEGAEFNINISAAFFPYSNWLGGFVRNSGDTNGGANNLFTGSPGLVLGTHFIDNGGGQSIVDLTSLGVDSRSSGVLLVTHGGNEDNYAASHVNTNDGSWTIYIKDNGTDAGSYEQDPVAFVYIPKTNTAVVSGRFRGDGASLMFSGATQQFSVTNISVGNWRLTINGHNPSSGVLIISAEGGFSQNQDNIVSYQPDGDGWIIQSRDLPGPNLQTPGSGLEPVASFVFIPGPITTTLLSPTNNAQNITGSASLQVNVSNSLAGPLTVKFYGRPANTNPPSDFSLVALPDTQFYVSSLHGGVPEMFYSQAEWIITNRISRNIAYVAQLGDLTQNGDLKGTASNQQEWLNATNALYRVESPARTFLANGIPYGVAVGNHDEEPIGSAEGTTIFYNQYFGIPHFTGRSYYAGHYGTNNDNHFDFFSAGGMDFVVIYFKYDTNANPAVLSWANQILQNNPNRRGIVITHNLGNTQTPVNFSPQGSAIYNALKANANLFLMLAGHVTGEGSRVDTFNGHTVRTFVQDFQGWTNGGNGFLRIMEFSPKNNNVLVQTYSPWTGEYETDSNSEFVFNYDMNSGLGGPSDAPFVALGTNVLNSASGTNTVSWPSLKTFTSYEWYVTVTDTNGNVVTSPLWRFTTAPNLPPTASNMTRTIPGDEPANLQLIATDPNGDTLSFTNRTSPTRGLLDNFSPAGSFTYSPARGFRGLDRFTFSASDGQFTTSIATININVLAPADTNANGLPDSWEMIYGVTDAAADDDGDGRSNIDEYYANTDPTSAASALRITSTTWQSNHFGMTWASVGGTRYRVQYQNAGASGLGNSFNDITRAIDKEMDAAPYGSNSAQTFLDDFTLTGGAPANQSRYYRVKVVP